MTMPERAPPISIPMPAGWNNPKGRLLASFRVFRRGDSYYLCLPTDLIETVISRLRMFILRSNVTLEEASDTFVHLGISGSKAEDDLRKFAGALPDNTPGWDVVTTP